MRHIYSSELLNVNSGGIHSYHWFLKCLPGYVTHQPMNSMIECIHLKFIVIHLATKSLAFYGILRAITVVTKSHHCALFWPSLIQSMPSHTILIYLSPHLYVSPPSFVEVFEPKFSTIFPFLTHALCS